MKNNIIESIISIAIILLAVALTDALPFWMPNAVHVVLLALLIVAFALFAIFFWQEKPRDEREELHRRLAGRIAFLVGGTVLTTGIVVQSYSHTLDPWLIYTLVSMVIAKLLAGAYSRHRW